MKTEKRQSNKMLLYGKNSIRERLVVNPKSIKRIILKDDFSHGEILSLIKKNSIPVEYKSEKELEKTKRADRLQGIIAEINGFTYTPIEDLLEEKDKHTIIFLDGLNDPQNLGSILRITACFGKFALCIPLHGSCEINDTVLHVASGAENYVPVAQVTNFINTIIKAKQAGYWVAGTDVDNGTALKDGIMPFPLCLVLGSEGKGVSPSLKKHVDLILNIPTQGASLSLNVAMACSIFCYEISKQRDKK